jgi:hypothetical protein
MNHPFASDIDRAASASPVESPGTRPAQSPPLDFPDLLDRMTPVERLRAYRSGTFTRRERTIWAARFPEEAPLLNGELEWIARTAE